MTKHQKHTNIIKKHTDNFAPNEIAILGTNCTIISDLVNKLSQNLSQYNIGYFDASHAKDVAPNTLSTYTFHHEGNVDITSKLPINKYVQRLQFSQYDIVFINGNHYQGAKQILILDEKKESSVEKRLSQITNIQFIIKLTDDVVFFPCLEEKFPHIKNITTYHINDIDAITKHTKAIVEALIPPLNGLVLTGGKSTRMGSDKSLLNYHGKPQKEHAKTLLNQKLDKVYLSVKNTTNNEAEIADSFINLGPFGGICSAFQQNPNTAWFVLATDLPFVNETLIQKIITERDPSKVATTVKGIDNEFPEPLITIYEPKAYPILLQYLAQGYSCPRKMLINSDVKVIDVPNVLIQNINTPEEYLNAKKEIKQKK